MDPSFRVLTPSHCSSAQPLQQGILCGGYCVPRQANTTRTLMAPSARWRPDTLRNATNSTDQPFASQRALGFIGPPVGGHVLQNGLSFVGPSAPHDVRRLHSPSTVTAQQDVTTNGGVVGSEMVPVILPPAPPRIRFTYTGPPEFAHLFTDADLERFSRDYEDFLTSGRYDGYLRSMHPGLRSEPGIHGQQLEAATRRRVATVDDTEECCVVCQSNFAEGDELRVLPCGHTYHVACVDQWFARSKQCPMCKAVVQQKSKVCRRRRRLCC